jgi:hypothetical protein
MHGMTVQIQQTGLVSPAAQAHHVIAVTATAWRVAPRSPHEVARRAPHGYVPLRVLRRLQAAPAAPARPVIAHSW